MSIASHCRVLPVDPGGISQMLRQHRAASDDHHQLDHHHDQPNEARQREPESAGRFGARPSLTHAVAHEELPLACAGPTTSRPFPHRPRQSVTVTCDRSRVTPPPATETVFNSLRDDGRGLTPAITIDNQTNSGIQLHRPASARPPSKQKDSTTTVNGRLSGQQPHAARPSSAVTAAGPRRSVAFPSSSDASQPPLAVSIAAAAATPPPPVLNNRPPLATGMPSSHNCGASAISSSFEPQPAAVPNHHAAGGAARSRSPTVLQQQAGRRSTTPTSTHPRSHTPTSTGSHENSKASAGAGGMRRSRVDANAAVRAYFARLGAVAGNVAPPDKWPWEINPAEVDAALRSGMRRGMVVGYVTRNWVTGEVVKPPPAPVPRTRSSTSLMAAAMASSSQRPPSPAVGAPASTAVVPPPFTLVQVSQMAVAKHRKRSVAISLKKPATSYASSLPSVLKSVNVAQHFAISTDAACRIQRLVRRFLSLRRTRHRIAVSKAVKVRNAMRLALLGQVKRKLRRLARQALLNHFRCPGKQTAAWRIQSWYRGYVVRHHVVPFLTQQRASYVHALRSYERRATAAILVQRWFRRLQLRGLLRSRFRHRRHMATYVVRSCLTAVAQDRVWRVACFIVRCAERKAARAIQRMWRKHAAENRVRLARFMTRNKLPGFS